MNELGIFKPELYELGFRSKPNDFMSEFNYSTWFAINYSVALINIGSL